MPVSIAEITADDIAVYPNPISENSIVSLPHELQTGYFAIHDLNGKSIETGKFETNIIPLEKMSRAQKGTYVISLMDNHYQYIASTKLIVE
jgi:hypothetical protein